MRTIKFRAWDKINNKMILDCGEYKHYAFGINYQKDIEFQQFTGLLDKNGKEICEGDIMKSKNNKNTRHLIGKVYFKFGKFRIEYGFMNPEKEDRKGTFMSTDIADNINGLVDWEVIGNIYENKELLQ